MRRPRKTIRHNATGGGKKALESALILPNKLLQTKNYNMFAGDKEYKTNFLLRFLTPITFNRFQKDKFQRYFYPGRVFCLFMGLLLIILGTSFLLFGDGGWYSGIIGLFGFMACLFAYKFIKLKYTNSIVRTILTVAFISYQGLIWNMFSTSVSLSLFLFPGFIANLLFVYEWWRSLIYTSIDFGILLIMCWLQLIPIIHFTTYCALFCISFAATVMFAFFEKAMKEEWVLYESFKKSDKIFSYLLDTNPQLIFVVDNNGKILYKNKLGSECILSNISGDRAAGHLTQPSTTTGIRGTRWFKAGPTPGGGESLIDLVVPHQKDELKIILKAAMQNKQPNFMLMIKGSKQNALGGSQGTDGYGLDPTLLKEGYQVFEVKMERTYWKSGNALMLTLVNKMEEKISLHSLVIQMLKITNYSENNKYSADTENSHDTLEEEKKEDDIVQIPPKAKMFAYREISQIMAYQNLLGGQLLIGEIDMEEIGFNSRDMLIFIAESLATIFIQNHSQLILKISFDLPAEILLGSLLLMVAERSQDSEIKLITKMNGLSANKKYEFQFDIEFKQSEQLVFEELEKILQINKFTSKVLLDNQESVSKYGLGIFVSQSLIQVMKGKISYKLDQGKIIINLMVPFGQKDRGTNIISMPPIPHIPIGEQDSKVNIHFNRENMETNIAEVNKKSKEITDKKETEELEKLRKEIESELSTKFNMEMEEKLKVQKQSMEKDFEKEIESLKEKLINEKFKVNAKDNGKNEKIYPQPRKSDDILNYSDTRGVAKRPSVLLADSEVKMPNTPLLSSKKLLLPANSRVTQVKTDLQNFETERIKQNLVKRLALKTTIETPKLGATCSVPIANDFTEDARNRIRDKIMGKDATQSMETSIKDENTGDVNLEIPTNSKSELVIENFNSFTNKDNIRSIEGEKSEEGNNSGGIKPTEVHTELSIVNMKYKVERLANAQSESPLKMILNSKLEVNQFELPRESGENEIDIEEDSAHRKIEEDGCSLPMHEERKEEFHEKIIEETPRMFEEKKSIPPLQHYAQPPSHINKITNPPRPQDDIILSKRSSIFFEELDNLVVEDEFSMLSSPTDPDIPLNRANILLSPVSETAVKKYGDVRSTMVLASKQRLNMGQEKFRNLRKTLPNKNNQHTKTCSVGGNSDQFKYTPIKGKLLQMQKEKLLKSIQKSSVTPKRMGHNFVFIPQKAADLSITGNFDDYQLGKPPTTNASRITEEQKQPPPKIEEENEREREKSPIIESNQARRTGMKKDILGTKSTIGMTIGQPDCEISPNVNITKRKQEQSPKKPCILPPSVAVLTKISTDMLPLRLPPSPIITDKIRIMRDGGQMNTHGIKHSEATRNYQEMLRNQKPTQCKWERNMTPPTSIKMVARILQVPKVLLVEDNNFSLNCLIGFVKRLKFEFDVAHNGVQAVDKFKNAAANESLFYTMIFMDLMMPLMDGFEATKIIREIEKEKDYSHTFICGLSAHADLKTEEKCRKCGMDNYISKPINITNMQKIIVEQFDLLKKKTL